MKICVKCKVEKPESEFSKDKSKKDGLNYLCKGCRQKERREIKYPVYCLCGCGEKLFIYRTKYIKGHKTKKDTNKIVKREKIKYPPIFCKFCNIFIEHTKRYNQLFCNRKCMDSWKLNKTYLEIYGEKTARQLLDKRKNTTKNSNRIKKDYGTKICPQCRNVFSNNREDKKFCNKECSFLWAKGKDHSNTAGTNWNDRLGVERAKEIREVIKNRIYGKTYEEIYGEDIAKEIKLKQSKSQTNLYKNEEYYNKMIEIRAKSINRKWTSIEKILWYILNIDYNGCEIISQYVVGKAILDFAIKSVKLDFEADGEYWHKDKEKDKRRDSLLEKQGWTVVRYTEKYLNDWKKYNKIKIGCI